MKQRIELNSTMTRRKYVLSKRRNLQILTAEFTVELGSSVHWGKTTVLCLWSVTGLL